jgi:hypothetical protein
VCFLCQTFKSGRIWREARRVLDDVLLALSPCSSFNFSNKRLAVFLAMASFLRHKRGKFIAFLCFMSVYFLVMNVSMQDLLIRIQHSAFKSYSDVISAFSCPKSCQKRVPGYAISDETKTSRRSKIYCNRSKSQGSDFNGTIFF